MPNFTENPARPWWENRSFAVEKRLRDLKVGDALLCNNGEFKIIYIFLKSKLPQYIIYRNKVKIFPKTKASTPRREDVLEYILGKSELDREYIDHIDMKYVRNGGISHMSYLPQEVATV